MPRLQHKSFDTPDESRTFIRGTAGMVTLGDSAVGRGRWEPGWRWSVDLAPVMGTGSCQLHHLGYSISGILDVMTDEGETMRIPPGSVYEIPAGHDAWVVGDEPWETVEWTSARSVGVAPGTGGEQTLATLVFTDIVESTATLERLGDAAWRDLLVAHNARLREVLNVFRGREVRTTGDGFIAMFDSAARAVRAAAAMTRGARALGLSIRAGVHTGEVESMRDDVRGLTVHTAARVMSLAAADEVMVSSATAGLLEGSGLVIEDAGTHELKGLTGARRIFRLVTPAADRPG